MKGLILAVLLLPLFAVAKPYAGPSTISEVAGLSDNGLVVGGWDGSRWVPDTNWHVRVRGRERYRFYTPEQHRGEAIGKKAVLSEASGSAWRVHLNHVPLSKQDCIGLTGSWNAMPRKFRELNTESAVFKAAVEGVLKEHGLAGAPAKVTRAISVDLDGDGGEEAIISATNPRLLESSGEALMSARPSDYSFVMMRGQRNGRYVTTVLAGQFKPGKNDTPNVFLIGPALDLNGDGKMEIVVRWRYYEGGGVQVFELKGGHPRKVLAASDGA